RLQPVAVDLERLGFAHRGGIDERRLAGKLAQLARERSRTVLDAVPLAAVRVATGNADTAGKHDVNARAHLAGLGHVLPVGKAPRAPEAAHALDLSGAQHRKSLRAATLHRRQLRLGQATLPSPTGSLRTRLPVAAKMALASAGMTHEVPG